MRPVDPTNPDYSEEQYRLNIPITGTILYRVSIDSLTLHLQRSTDELIIKRDIVLNRVILAN